MSSPNLSSEARLHASAAVVSCVWFKRDLRWADHAPLAEAAQRGPCILLYCFEPSMMTAPDADPAHVVFILDCLRELQQALRARGNRLLIVLAEAPAVLEAVYDSSPFTNLYSHQETGNAISYARDIRVGQWAKSKGILWQEFYQNGVIRRLKTRQKWAHQWEARMKQPLQPAPDWVAPPDNLSQLAEALKNRFPVWIDSLPSLFELGMPASQKTAAQAGGRTLGLATLNDFLTVRGLPYVQGMSSPNSAPEACSRISPYLAWGALSLGDVVHRLRHHQASVLDECQKVSVDAPEGLRRCKNWLAVYRSFHKRLHWHCHFMQKLEDEPAIETCNMNRAFDGMREPFWSDERFNAWCEGQTGYPLIDACMRSLRETGWLPFRMRAMVTSFAAYHLWLHWQRPAHVLARHFLDYEPGIHYSQIQMQSGVTGINAIRIYSPLKQAQDHDPYGHFIRRWVPELATVPAPWIFEPHTLPDLEASRLGFRVGKDYPLPIVDHAEAYRQAKEALWQWKRTPEARAQAKIVLDKHGSRQQPAHRKARRATEAKASAALKTDAAIGVYQPLLF
ncbi:MAG: FAD-binding domain-containing protein [Vampirovibrionales bacterium]|nr:FAD-binding domain-containing protein [Vampirovibrionales bacterium]